VPQVCAFLRCHCVWFKHHAHAHAFTGLHAHRYLPYTHLWFTHGLPPHTHYAHTRLHTTPRFTAAHVCRLHYARYAQLPVPSLPRTPHHAHHYAYTPCGWFTPLHHHAVAFWFVWFGLQFTSFPTYRFTVTGLVWFCTLVGFTFTQFTTLVYHGYGYVLHPVGLRLPRLRLRCVTHVYVAELQFLWFTHTTHVAVTFWFHTGLRSLVHYVARSRFARTVTHGCVGSHFLYSSIHCTLPFVWFGCLRFPHTLHGSLVLVYIGYVHVVVYVTQVGSLHWFTFAFALLYTLLVWFYTRVALTVCRFTLHVRFGSFAFAFSLGYTRLGWFTVHWIAVWFTGSLVGCLQHTHTHTWVGLRSTFWFTFTTRLQFPTLHRYYTRVFGWLPLVRLVPRLVYGWLVWLVTFYYRGGYVRPTTRLVGWFTGLVTPVPVGFAHARLRWFYGCPRLDWFALVARCCIGFTFTRYGFGWFTRWLHVFGWLRFWFHTLCGSHTLWLLVVTPLRLLVFAAPFTLWVTLRCYVAPRSRLVGYTTPPHTAHTPAHTFLPLHLFLGWLVLFGFAGLPHCHVGFGSHTRLLLVTHTRFQFGCLRLLWLFARLRSVYVCGLHVGCTVCSPRTPHICVATRYGWLRCTHVYALVYVALRLRCTLPRCFAFVYTFSLQFSLVGFYGCVTFTHVTHHTGLLRCWLHSYVGLVAFCCTVLVLPHGSGYVCYRLVWLLLLPFGSLFTHVTARTFVTLRSHGSHGWLVCVTVWLRFALGYWLLRFALVGYVPFTTRFSLRVPTWFVTPGSRYTHTRGVLQFAGLRWFTLFGTRCPGYRITVALPPRVCVLRSSPALLVRTPFIYFTPTRFTATTAPRRAPTLHRFAPVPRCVKFCCGYALFARLPTRALPPPHPNYYARFLVAVRHRTCRPAPPLLLLVPTHLHTFGSHYPTPHTWLVGYVLDTLPPHTGWVLHLHFLLLHTLVWILPFPHTFGSFAVTRSRLVTFGCAFTTVGWLVGLLFTLDSRPGWFTLHDSRLHGYPHAHSLRCVAPLLPRWLRLRFTFSLVCVLHGLVLYWLWLGYRLRSGCVDVGTRALLPHLPHLDFPLRFRCRRGTRTPHAPRFTLPGLVPAPGLRYAPPHRTACGSRATLRLVWFTRFHHTFTTRLHTRFIRFDCRHTGYMT